MKYSTGEVKNSLTCRENALLDQLYSVEVFLVLKRIYTFWLLNILLKEKHFSGGRVQSVYTGFIVFLVKIFHHEGIIFHLI